MSTKKGDLRRPQQSARTMIDEQLLHMQELEPAAEQAESATVVEFAPQRTEPLINWADCGALPLEFDETKDDGMYPDDYEDYDRFPERREDLVYGGRW